VREELPLIWKRSSNEELSGEGMEEQKGTETEEAGEAERRTRRRRRRRRKETEKERRNPEVPIGGRRGQKED